MQYAAYTVVTVMLLLFGAACEDAVLDVEPPIDSVEDERLNREDQVPFLVTGVQAKFAQTYDQITMFAGGLSDELVFDRSVPGATYPTYAELDNGNITLSNASVSETMLILGQLRLLADTLVTRVDRIAFTDPDSRGNALYNGYFYGAIARYLWGAYFGLEPERGGGVINAGPFIPSADMYAQALDLLDLAVQSAPTEYDERAALSLKARIHLLEGRYTEADAAARGGLKEGDVPLGALYSTDLPNGWHYGAGAGRTQFVVDDRYVSYLITDPDEEVRIPLVQKTQTRFRQDKYPELDSPLPFVTWQEMVLIQAEAALRDGQTGPALNLVNTVRQSHGLEDLEDITLEGLLVEREKEMFCMGIRLLDQRRTGDWHLPEGTWKYLPITQRERDSNPNLN